MRLRFNLGAGKYVEATVEDRGLVEKYTNLNMERLFVLTDEKGFFKTAINPKMIVSIEAI